MPALGHQAKQLLAMEVLQYPLPARLLQLPPVKAVPFLLSLIIQILHRILTELKYGNLIFMMAMEQLMMQMLYLPFIQVLHLPREQAIQ